MSKSWSQSAAGHRERRRRIREREDAYERHRAEIRKEVEAEEGRESSEPHRSIEHLTDAACHYAANVVDGLTTAQREW